MYLKIVDWVGTWQIDPNFVELISHTIVFGGLLLVCLFAYLAGRFIIGAILPRIVAKTKATWDDVFLEFGIFKRLAHLVWLVVAYALVPLAYPEGFGIRVGFQKALVAGLWIVGASILNTAINAGHTLYLKRPESKQRPILTYLQILKFFVTTLAAVLALTSVLEINPTGILGTIGALSAVLLLVFRDVILGLVASIQISTGKLVKRGDFIELPKLGISGEVIDMSLQAIKIQSPDRSYAMLPLYNLINEGFRNLRGIQESGGYRLRLFLIIDPSSIKFSDSSQAQTNLGHYKADVCASLQAREELDSGGQMFFQLLDQRPEGLPIEIIAFTTVQDYPEFLKLATELQELCFAKLPQFELRLARGHAAH